LDATLLKVFYKALPVVKPGVPIVERYLKLYYSLKRIAALAGCWWIRQALTPTPKTSNHELTRINTNKPSAMERSAGPGKHGGKAESGKLKAEIRMNAGPDEV
jgi:hypothetical protein